MFTYDTDGRRVPPGRILKRQSEDFESGALPSWLTKSSGGTDTGSTATFVAPTTAGVPGVKLAKSTTAGNRVTLVAPSFNLNSVQAACVRAVVTIQRTANVHFVLGLQDLVDTKHGGVFRRLATESTHELVAYSTRDDNGASATIKTPVTYDDQTTAGKRYDLAFWITPADKTLYFFEGDQMRARFTPQPIAGVVANPLGTGTVTPYIRLAATDAVAHEMTLHQFTVERWYA